MNAFRTTFDLTPDERKIDHNSNILMMGSCFSDNVGQKLRQDKFNVVSNPYGVLYNPYSIQEAVSHILGHRKIEDDDLVENEGLWHSYLHHSSFSMPDKENLLEKIEETRIFTLNHLKKTDFLFITFGTAWVYQLAKNRKIVANCHKMPAKHFQRFRLSVCDITDEFSNLIQRIEAINPDIHIVFTLSPVRHLKDGFVQNQISKSTLNVAIHDLLTLHTGCSYFPSYELVMDDLRDYRFYTEDMTHLSPVAVDYIYNRFSEKYMNQNTRKNLEKVRKLAKAVQHRPFNPQTEEYATFLKKTSDRIHDLQIQHPGQDWSHELDIIKNRLNEI